MKKTLVALAALAATSAYAQSSVEIYGVMDAAYKTTTIKNNYGDVLVKSTGINDGTNAGNRIGFRGTENLGSGLNAKFVFETGMVVAGPDGFANRAGAEGAQVAGISNSGNIPLGAYGSNSNTRQAFIALADAKLGELRVGYQYTELYNTSTNTGFYVGQEQAGGFLHKISNAEFGGTRGNSIVYISPKIAGTTTLTAQMGSGTAREEYSTGLAAGQNGYVQNDAKRSSVGALFEQGPLRAGAAYTTYKQTQTLGTTTTVTSVFGVTAAGKAQTFESNLTQLNASYDFGMIKPSVQYVKGQKDLTAQTNYTATTGDLNGVITYTLGKYDYTATTYGFTAPLGAATFFFNTGTGKISSATADINDYKQTQYGVRYALSKRTTAYAASGTTKDSLAAATSASAANGKATYSAIGIAHSF